MEKYVNSHPNVTIPIYPHREETGYCNEVPSNFMRLIRPPDSELPWTGVIFGLCISHIWYFCVDQVHFKNINFSYVILKYPTMTLDFNF